MNNKTKKLLISTLLGASIGVSAVALASCGGSYKLTDFSVDTSNATKVYEIDSEVTFDGLKLIAGYSDGESEIVDVSDERVRIFLGEEDITENLSKLTEEAGEKKVKFVFTTKYGEMSKEISITVSAKQVTYAELASYTAPIFIANYNATIAKADNDDTAPDFESKFFKTDVMNYSVGSDNAFKFLPEAYDDDLNTLSSVVVNSTVKMLVDDAYVTLTKTNVEGQSYVYEYAYEDQVMVVENATTNEFDFASEAISNTFKLSVLPDETTYGAETVSEFDAVEFEFEVVDGYNVYSAYDLCVMDNSNRNEWKDLKAQLGLTDVQTNGIILHNNLKVTSDHIPTEFTYTLQEGYNIEYKLGATVGSPESFGLKRTFLWDSYRTLIDKNGGIYDAYHVNLFVRVIKSGGNFNFYGNYYDIDLSELPLVASFDAGVTPSQDYVNNSSTWYGTNFSNAKFLLVVGDQKTWGEGEETCNFKNVSVHGNSQVDQLLVTQNTTGFQKESLVYCGSIIFVTMDGCSGYTENVRAYKFFIPFFVQHNAASTYVRTKCYDSANNALYGRAKVVIDIQQSYFQRSGGPLILVRQTDYDKANKNETRATLTIDANSVMESYVSGTEAWFQSVNATGIVAQFQGLNQVLTQMNRSMFNTSGKMNVIAVMMGEMDTADAAISAIGVQGQTTYGSVKLDRNQDSVLGATIYGIASQMAQAGQVAPIFNFGDNVYYYAGQYGIMTPTAPTTPNGGAAGMYQDINSASHFTLNYGGLGVMLGLFDHVTQS